MAVFEDDIVRVTEGKGVVGWAVGVPRAGGCGRRKADSLREWKKKKQRQKPGAEAPFVAAFFRGLKAPAPSGKAKARTRATAKATAKAKAKAKAWWVGLLVFPIHRASAAR